MHVSVDQLCKELVLILRVDQRVRFAESHQRLFATVIRSKELRMALSHDGEVRFVLLHVRCSLGLTRSLLLLLHLLGTLAAAGGLGKCCLCLFHVREQ